MTPPVRLPAPVPETRLRVVVTGDRTQRWQRIVDALRADASCAVVAGEDAESAHADVVVAALDAPAADRPQEIRRAVESLGAIPLVLVTPQADTRGVRKALAAGAVGVVLEEGLEAALPFAVGAVAAGYLLVPRSQGGTALRPELSHRERQVLRLAALGRTNSEIAVELCLAESTIKTHLSSAFKALGVCSRRQAAALVFDPDEGLYAHVFGPIPP